MVLGMAPSSSASRGAGMLSLVILASSSFLMPGFSTAASLAAALASSRVFAMA